MNKITAEQKKQLLEQVSILEAFAEGVEVQYLGYNDKWCPKNFLPFDFDRFKYRIKPAEPLYYGDNVRVSCISQKNAEKGSDSFIYVGKHPMIDAHIVVGATTTDVFTVQYVAEK